MSIHVELITSLLEMPAKFAAVAAHDPVSALLMLVGAVLTLASSGVFGVLALRGLAAGVSGGPDAEPRQPSR